MRKSWLYHLKIWSSYHVSFSSIVLERDYCLIKLKVWEDIKVMFPKMLK